MEKTTNIEGAEKAQKLSKKISLNKILLIILVVILLVILGLFGNQYLKKRESSQNISKYEELISSASIKKEAREYADSLKLYIEASEILPYRTSAYEGIVDVLLEKKLYKKAEEVIEALETKLTADEIASISNKIGDSYYEDADWGNASKSYKKSTNLSADSSYRFKLAKAYLQEGKYSEAKSLLNSLSGDEEFLLRAIVNAQDLDTSEISNILSKTSCTKEDKTDICNKINELKNILDLIAKNGNDELFARTVLAKFIINYGFPKLANDTIKDEITDQIEYWEANYIYGLSSLAIEDYDKAVENISSAINQGCVLGECYLSLARAYRFNGELAKAQDSYEKAVIFSVDTEKEAIYEEYVEYLIEQKLHVKAEEYVLAYSNKTDEEKYKNMFNLLNIYLDINDLKKAKDVVLSLEKIFSKIIDSEDKLRCYIFLTEYYLRSAESPTSEGNSNSSNLSTNIKKYLDELELIDQMNPYRNLFAGRYELLYGDKSKGEDYLEQAIDSDTEGDVTSIARKFLKGGE